MDLLGALGILVRVVETGSFSAVARERELSQAAVARQVSQLEEHCGPIAAYGAKWTSGEMVMSAGARNGDGQPCLPYP
jgi:hypothetical protein